MKRSIGTLAISVLVLAGTLSLGPAVAFGFDGNRIVRFRGARMSCQQVHSFSEDQIFAGKFQELRKSAVNWRRLTQQVQIELDRGARWSRVNNVLRELTHAVGAIDTIRSIVAGDAAAEGAKSVILGSIGIPDVRSIQSTLHAINVQLANANDRTWAKLKSQLRSQLSVCQRYAEQYERDSNDVIQALMDARRVLKTQCR